MNYKNIYDKIIERAKSRILDGYTERHHIIPRSMGGSDEESNIVILTAREHYLCHWLLAKYTNDRRMWMAFSMMAAASDKHIRITNGKIFERARIAMSIATTGANNPMFGKKSACVSHTEETKLKIRLSKLGKKRTPFKRMSPSQETKDKISAANKGKIAYNKGIEEPKYQCIHCLGMFNPGNLKRWHGDNCKQNKIATCNQNDLLI